MTEQGQVYLSDLHFEHIQWLSELKFWDEELNSFNKRLEEVVGRYTSNEARAKIEHFQNRFLLNHIEITKLIKNVNQHEKVMARYAAHHLSSLEDTPVNDHTSLRDKMETQRIIYVDLKAEYYKFLASSN